ncbi:DNA topoisomerase IV subunit A [Candidatus Fermentibacteria bacterium]|nr:DNA topoisomerase IV subunit A [Candidatus Fermentibacteria bacterium]
MKSLFRDNFLDYASYVIKDRAIPDADDGLKPVQRRILWGLHELDDGRFNKVANVIGHCMRYHPHGDQSIGDALVALANRGYFIDRQGNFGNILTGDEASAPRYIECRLTDLARETLFNDRITSFTESYDGRNREPEVLPAKLPVILLLGVEGIAVGMSTRILPHNFCEVLQAQVAFLRGKPFTLHPDFPQGGSIDVSGYDDGAGRIRNRATIEKKKGQKKLVIREIPWGTTTESLIASIEAAARKGRVKVASIDDFTAEKIEIEVTLARGAEPDDTIQQLYAHTDCEMSYTSNILVILDGKPVECRVSDLLRRSTEKLLEILRRELELEKSDLEEKIRWMTLEMIFIENRIYKKIEECRSWEDVTAVVRSGMKPHLDGIVLSEEDIEKLLSIRIRRISRFDMEAHRREMGEAASRMEAVKHSLAHLKQYAIDCIQTLLKRFGRLYPRLTRIESFNEVDVKEVALRNLRVGYDPAGSFVGTTVKGEVSFEATEYDRIIAFFEDGSYRVLPMAEKHFLDGRPVFCGIHDRERTYSAAYRDPETRIASGKRFRVEGYILEKEYRFLPEGTELMIFTDRPEGTLEYWFERRARMKTRKGSTTITEIALKGVAARGVRLGGGRPVSSMSFVEAPRPPEGAATAGGEGDTTGIEPASAGDASGPTDAGDPECQPPKAPAKPAKTLEQIMKEAAELADRSSRLAGDAPDLFDPD